MLDCHGFGYLWNDGSTRSPKYLKKMFAVRARDIGIASLFEEARQLKSLDIYTLSKEEASQPESYTQRDFDVRRTCSIIRLNQKYSLPWTRGMCSLCNEAIGDPWRHFLYDCVVLPSYDAGRGEFPPYPTCFPGLSLDHPGSQDLKKRIAFCLLKQRRCP